MLEAMENLTFASAPSGRCLVVVGSVHGNEPAGRLAIEKIKELVENKNWHIDGDVYGLIGNPLAIKSNERFVEENLNRAFGRAEIPGSYEEKRSEEITAWFKELAAQYTEMYLLDLHSVSLGNTRIAIYNVENKRAEKWAREVSPIPFFLAEREEVLPGSLMGAFEKLGGTGIAVECGNHSSEEGATVALEHIERALESLGMLTERKVSFKGTVQYEGTPRTYELTAPIKPHAGFVWDLPVASELFVAKGTQFAHDDLGTHVAPEDCYIIMPSKVPQPEDFDAGFLAIKTA